MLKIEFTLSQQKTPFIESLLYSFYSGEMTINNEVVKSDIERLFYIKKIGTNQSPNIVCLYLDDKSKVIKGLIAFQKDKNKFTLLKQVSKNSNLFSIVESSSIIGSLQHKFEKGNKVLLLKDILFDLSKSYYEYIGLFLPSPKTQGSRNTYRFVFDKPNMFSVSVLDSIYKDKDFYIINFDDIDEGTYLFDIRNMSKKCYQRHDIFYLNKDTGVLSDFIITFFKKVVQNIYLPIYYLFESNQFDDYSFTKRSLCIEELKNIVELKHQCEFNVALKERISKCTYEDFLLIYNAQKEVESIDKLDEYKEEVVEEIAVTKHLLDENFIQYITSSEIGGVIEDNYVFFPEYENFPLIEVLDDEIKIKTNRFSNDTYKYPYSIKQFKSKEKEFKSRLFDLMFNHRSSRIHTLKALISKIKNKKFNKDEADLINSVNYEIALSFASLWESDYRHFSQEIENLEKEYVEWKVLNSLEDISISEESELLFTAYKDDASSGSTEDYSKRKPKQYIDKSLYLLGQIAGRVSKIYEQAEQYGFKRKNIHIFEYKDLTNFDYGSLKTDKHRVNTFVVLGQSPHSAVGKGLYDSPIDMFKNEKDLLPLFEICEYNNASNSLAPISASRLIKAFETFNLDKINI